MSVKRYVKLLNAAVQALFYSVRLTHYSCPDKPGLMNQHKETSVRTFRRTEAGTAALEDKNSGLSVEYRRILEQRSEEHTSELQSRLHLVCRLLLEKKKKKKDKTHTLVETIRHITSSREMTS